MDITKNITDNIRGLLDKLDKVEAEILGGGTCWECDNAKGRFIKDDLIDGLILCNNCHIANLELLLRSKVLQLEAEADELRAEVLQLRAEADELAPAEAEGLDNPTAETITCHIIGG